jgi:TM2 domain-containing membrane protein YozV
MALVTCEECNHQVSDQAVTCPSCGCPFEVEEKKDRTVAALLAIILGTIGAHKFYLGKLGDGIIFLLLCWTGIPTVLGIIEGIIYLAHSQKSFEKRYVV